MSKPIAKIVITLYPGNRVDVEGPLHDAVLAYGLLSVAKDQIQAFHAQQEKRIVTVPGVIVPDTRS